MLSGEGGVCSDFSQIFCVFCLINNIRVREWGCVDRMYKSRFGHSFNEVYAPELQKWVAIDIHKSIIFKNSHGEYLSAVELFGDLRLTKPVLFDSFSTYLPPKPYRIPLVYSSGTIPFLIDNYCIAVNDRFCTRFQKFPPMVINVIMILYRKNYRFVFVKDNYREKLLPKNPLRV